MKDQCHMGNYRSAFGVAHGNPQEGCKFLLSGVRGNSREEGLKITLGLIGGGKISFGS